MVSGVGYLYVSTTLSLVVGALGDFLHRDFNVENVIFRLIDLGPYSFRDFRCGSFKRDVVVEEHGDFRKGLWGCFSAIGGLVFVVASCWRENASS